MRRILLLGLIMLLSVPYCTAQKETWNWAFGTGAGLTWHPDKLRSLPATGLNGTPDATLDNLPGTFTSSINTQEGCFTISDKDGNLICYSEGISIWKADGTKIYSALGGHISSAQSGIALPYPGDPKRYICIGLDLMDANNMGYVVVKANSPDDVVVEGNRIAFSGHTGILGESMSAVRHANGVDWWIVAPGKATNTSLNAWLATPSGVQATSPVTTNTGIQVKAYTSNGYLKFTPDGKHFAYATWNEKKIIFGDFDTSSGKFSNIKYIGGVEFYGVEFSPSGRYLYCTDYCFGAVRAYDFRALLAASAPAAITPKKLTDMRVGGALQLAPDGRIYAISSLSPTHRLYIIDNPDEYNNLKTYSIDGIYKGSLGVLGLPSFTGSFFLSVIEGEDNFCMDTVQRFSLEVTQGSGDIELSHTEWDFGDGSPEEKDSDFSAGKQEYSHSYTKPGKYTITVKAFLKKSGEESTEQRRTLDVTVNPCVMPVNPNIHLY